MELISNPVIGYPKSSSSDPAPESHFICFDTRHVPARSRHDPDAMSGFDSNERALRGPIPHKQQKEYVVRVHWSDGTVNVVYRRYSRFFSLQSKVLDKFPRQAGVYNPAERIIPFLPGKIFFGRSQVRRVALERMQKIHEYCKALVRLPSEISECKEIKVFFEPTEEDLQPSPDNVIRHSSVSGAGRGSVSEPLLLEQYVSIADYLKDGRNETSLRAGSVVEVVEKNETGWWFVNTPDGQGWVPSSYLEKSSGEDNRILPTSSLRGSKYICTNDYTAEDNDEISLKKGGYVEVLEKNLDGWWLVRYEKKEGRAPSTYLSAIDTLKARRLLKKSHKKAVEIIPTAQHASNVSAVRRRANDQVTSVSPLNARNGGGSEIGGRRWPKGNDDNNKHDSSTGASQVQINTGLFRPKIEHQLGNQHKWEFRDQNREKSYLDMKNSPAVTQEDSDVYEILDDWAISSDAMYVDSDFAHASSGVPFAHQVVSNESLESIGSVSSEGDSPMETKVPPRKKTLERSIQKLDQTMNEAESENEEIYCVIESYKNTAGDGIDLVEGEEVTVLEKTDVGWWFVVGIHGEGWAPAAFIQKVATSAVAKPKQVPPRPPPPNLAKKSEKTRDQSPDLTVTQAQGTSSKVLAQAHPSQLKPKPVPRQRDVKRVQNTPDTSTKDSSFASECKENIVNANRSGQRFDDVDISQRTDSSGVTKPPALTKPHVGQDDVSINSSHLISRENKQPATSRTASTSNQSKPILPSKPKVLDSKPVKPNNKPVLPTRVRPGANARADTRGAGPEGGTGIPARDQSQEPPAEVSRVDKLKHMFENRIS